MKKLYVAGLADLSSFNPTNVLNYSEGICHNLTRVVIVCQTIDHRHGRIFGQIQNVLQENRKKQKSFGNSYLVVHIQSRASEIWQNEHLTGGWKSGKHNIATNFINTKTSLEHFDC